MEPFQDIDLAGRAARPRQRRHRPDHSQAVFEAHRAHRLRRFSVLRLAPDTATAMPIADFVLNDPRYKGAQILIAGKNFGCGSSREHAAWALSDYGFRVVIAPTFADIFFSNAGKNGIVLARLSEEEVDTLLKNAQKIPNYQLTVSLEEQTVTDGRGFSGEVRDRSLPQVLPARRARRYRPDAAARRGAGHV